MAGQSTSEDAGNRDDARDRGDDGEPAVGHRAGSRARRRQSRGLWLGIAGIALVAAVFLLHQLMAWPPHEDETLALFVGRDSLPAVIEHVTQERGGAPLHFLLAWAVAHLGFGLGGLRLVSALFAVASLPLVALLGLRLGGRNVALVATVARRTELDLPLPRRLRPHVQRLPLLLARVLARPASGARARRSRALGALGRDALSTVATHPYAVLLLGGQAAYVLVAARDRLKRGDRSGGRGARPRAAVLAHRSRARRAVRRRGRRRRREARGPRGGDAVPLAVAGRRDRRVVAGHARRPCGRGRRGGRHARSGASVRRLLGRRHRGRLRARATRGSASPESRHLIFLAPLLRRRGRDRGRPARSPDAGRGGRPSRCSSRRGRVGLAADAGALRVGADPRQAARADAEAWLATTSRDDDVLFGYEPLYLGAWERNRSLPADHRAPRGRRSRSAMLERAGSRSGAASGSSSQRAKQRPAASRGRTASTRLPGASRRAPSVRFSCSAPAGRPSPRRTTSSRRPRPCGGRRSGSATPT